MKKTTPVRALRSLIVLMLLALLVGPAAHAQQALAAADEPVFVMLLVGEGQTGQSPVEAQGQQGRQAQTEPMDASSWRVEQRRQVMRRFAVPAGGRPFTLDTRYGRVQVTPWNKSEIRVEAEMVGRSETQAGAEQILDALRVQFLEYDAHTGGVAVASQFGPALRGGRGASCRYEVNYHIWLPRTTALRLNAAFADVTISGDLKGPTDLAVDYGNLRTGRLDGPQNRVRITNGDCAIPFARQASLDARFARLQLDEARTVDLRNNYSDINIGTVGDLTVHSKYGDVSLGHVQNLRGASGYSRFSVERLSEELNMALQYCPDFEVRDFGPNFRQVTLEGGFSTVRLGFAEAPVFHFDVSTEQGQLLVDRQLVRVLSEESTSRRRDVLGVFGVAEARPTRPVRAASKVNVKMRNGTVRFSR